MLISNVLGQYTSVFDKGKNDNIRKVKIKRRQQKTNK